MSLIDIIDEVAERQIMKTETGEERLFGVLTGIVTENYHKDMPGCVCVKIPVRDQEADTLKWVKVVSPYSGTQWGQYFLPEKGDQVLLAFEGGNIEKPYVIGSIPLDRDQFLTKSVDEHNQEKRIVTRHGNEIAFTDHREGDGEKDLISIRTAGKAHELILDNDKKKMIFQDKEQNCRVEMQTERGEIEIRASKKLTIQVGDTITVRMNGDTGAVSVEARKVTIEASNKLECKTDGMAKLSGQQTVIEAGSLMKLDSSGMVIVAGSPVKIG